MGRHLLVYREGRLLADNAIDIPWLSQHTLYKTLSLVLAHRAGIPVPPTLLLTSYDEGSLRSVGELWGWPLMIRMDFAKLPKSKPLGGFPLNSAEIANRICDFLFRKGCLPLFHPHFDRFQNRYNLGLLLHPASHEVHVEIVGQGFDAGDLRLGKAIPHEVVKINLKTGGKEPMLRISDDEYKRERSARSIRVDAMRRYVTYINAVGMLSSTLQMTELSKYAPSGDIPLVPEKYAALPSDQWAKVFDIAMALQTDVIPALPASQSFAASLSLMPDRGWLLWDVYGHWYKR